MFDIKGVYLEVTIAEVSAPVTYFSKIKTAVNLIITNTIELSEYSKL